MATDLFLPTQRANASSPIAKIEAAPSLVSIPYASQICPALFHGEKLSAHIVNQFGNEAEAKQVMSDIQLSTTGLIGDMIHSLNNVTQNLNLAALLGASDKGHISRAIGIYFLAALRPDSYETYIRNKFARATPEAGSKIKAETDYLALINKGIKPEDFLENNPGAARLKELFTEIRLCLRANFEVDISRFIPLVSEASMLLLGPARGLTFIKKDFTKMPLLRKRTNKVFTINSAEFLDKATDQLPDGF